MALEGEVTKVEGAESTQTEVAKPTESKKQPTVDVTKTDEFRRELDKALGKGLESTNRQLSSAKAEAERIKAEAEVDKATLALMEDERKALAEERDRLAEERFADDPEALKGYRQIKAIELREKKLALKEKELTLKESEQAEKAFKITKAEIAVELQKQYKVPNKVLQECISEEQMRNIASAFPLVEEEQEETKEPNFDTGISSGSGGGELTIEKVMRMSPAERAARTAEIAKLPLGL